MNKTTLRSDVFEVLRTNPQTHLHAIENEIRHREEGYDRGDAILVHEVVWELLVQGVLAPGKNSLNLNLPFVHVTEYGERCLEEGGILAHDPEGYEKRLAEATGDRIPRVVVESAGEAARAFRADLHSTCLLLLSRAASILVSTLADRLVGYADPTASLGRNDVDLIELRNRLINRNPPAELANPLEPRFSELSAVIRLSQDAAGRPTTPPTDRDRALAHLLLFPEHCRFVYDLLLWLEAAPAAPHG